MLLPTWKEGSTLLSTFVSVIVIILLTVCDPGALLRTNHGMGVVMDISAAPWVRDGAAV